MLFVDRIDAGRRLAQEILANCPTQKSSAPEDTVVIGLPRGGVIVAIEVARELGCALDIFVSKKMRAPDFPELAIGAVSSTGVVMEDERLLRVLRSKEMLARYIQSQKEQGAELIAETKKLENYYRAQAHLASIDVSHKRVIVVDDGIATGMTASVTLKSLRAKPLLELILAAPVVSMQTRDELIQHCDLVIAPVVPADFTSVGQHYRDFHQVEDSEMIAAILEYSLQFSETLGTPVQS